MISSQLDARPLKKATGDWPGYTDLELKDVAVLSLIQYFALPVQHRQGLAIVRTHTDREVAKTGSNPGLQECSDRLECFRPKRGQKDRRCRVEGPNAPAQCLLLGVGQPIDLVEDQDLGAAPQIEVVENIFDHGLLLFPARERRVDHVGQQVSLAGLLERRAERRDEVVG